MDQAAGAHQFPPAPPAAARPRRGASPGRRPAPPAPRTRRELVPPARPRPGRRRIPRRSARTRPGAGAGRLAAPATSLPVPLAAGCAHQWSRSPYDSVSFPAAPFFPLPNPFRQVSIRRPAGCPWRPVYVLTAPGQYVSGSYPTSCFAGPSRPPGQSLEWCGRMPAPSPAARACASRGRAPDGCGIHCRRWDAGDWAGDPRHRKPALIRQYPYGHAPRGCARAWRARVPGAVW